MKPLKQVLNSKKGKILILIFLALALFGDKINLTGEESQAISKPPESECQQYGTDDDKCLAAGCVYADPGVGNYCTNCIQTGKKTYLTLGPFNEVKLLETFPEIYPENVCCEDYKMVDQSFPLEDYMLCVRAGTGEGACTGVQKQIADIFKFTKISNCQTRFFAGLGILFMAMMVMMTAI